MGSKWFHAPLPHACFGFWMSNPAPLDNTPKNTSTWVNWRLLIFPSVWTWLCMLVWLITSQGCHSLFFIVSMTRRYSMISRSGVLICRHPVRCHLVCDPSPFAVALPLAARHGFPCIDLSNSLSDATVYFAHLFIGETKGMPACRAQIFPRFSWFCNGSFFSFFF